MTSTIAPMCFSCKHFSDKSLVCDAFPDGIPDGVLETKIDHRQPYHSDNGIQFEQNPELPIPFAFKIFDGANKAT